MPTNEDEKKALYHKLGVPAEVAGYDIEGVEIDGTGLDKDSLAAYQKLAHEANLTKDQFKKILGYDLERFKSSATSTATADHERKNSYSSHIKRRVG